MSDELFQVPFDHDGYYLTELYHLIPVSTCPIREDQIILDMTGNLDANVSGGY